MSPDAGLIGRDRELPELHDLLRTRRVVTITGPGGVGKTRLAKAVVGRVAGQVAVCELAPVPDPGGVPAAVAETLGFPSVAAAALGWSQRSGLLLVDNAEHHLDVVAEVVEELVGACPTLTVLVTSREPLDVVGEHVYVLSPLAVPAEDDVSSATSSPAVQLFVARARAAGAALPADDTTAAAIASITRRLDGLPLAIELAAARARSLDPQDILRHLDARFELLTRRRERGPERHRSLEAAIGWSYERLEPSQQRFFARLGAFCGPFTLDAARTVAAEPGDSPTATLDRLDALVSRSLVTPVRHGAESAYLLPESVRLYARRQLDAAAEADVCDARCVDHYVGWALRLVERAQRAWSSEVVRSLLAAQLNLQDAIRWCLVSDATPTRATALFLPLWGLVHNARAENVRQLGDQILERWPDRDDPATATTAAITATAALVVGDVARARELIARALAAGGGVAAVIAGRAAYLAASHEGDDAAALGHLDAALALAEAEQLAPFAIELEIFRALSEARLGDLDAAERTAQRAQARAAAGDSEVLHVLARLAAAAVALDDPDRSRSLLGEAAELARRSHYPWGIGAAHRGLGALALATGDVEVARTELERSLDAFLAAGQLGEAAGTVRWIAGLLVAAGRPAAAGELLVPAAPSSPLLDVMERRYLDPLLTDLVPAERDLRVVVAAARTRLAELPASATQDAPAPAEPPRRSGSWIHEGAVWALTYAGTTVRLPDAKGLADLGTLLARPGREIAAAELMGAVVDSSDLGPVLDATARQRFEQRIRELQEDLDEAEGFGDVRRAETAREELDQLVDALTAATGLGGRTRRPGDSSERARSAVTRRIRDTIRRIAGVHPPLGHHLEASVRTGRWCVYAPTEPVEWTVRTTA